MKKTKKPGIVLWSRVTPHHLDQDIRGYISDEKGNLAIAYSTKNQDWICDDMERLMNVLDELMHRDFRLDEPKISTSNFVFSIGEVSVPTVFKGTHGLGYAALSVYVDTIIDGQYTPSKKFGKIREILMPDIFSGQKNPSILIRTYLEELVKNREKPVWGISANRSYIEQVFFRGTKPPNVWEKMLARENIEQRPWEHRVNLRTVDAGLLGLLRLFLPLK